MRPELQRKTSTCLLFVALVLSVGLRVPSIGHVVIYDEARNVNTFAAVASGQTQDIFFSNLWRHPPLYSTVGILSAKAAGGNRTGIAVIMEIFSILASLCLLVVIFICARDWFGTNAAVAAALLFAVMPASRALDTWIKPESMTLLFCLLYLLFFFRGRFILSGVFLGFGILSKEIAIFIPIAMLLFIVLTARFGRLLDLLKSAALAVLLSAWWFLFLSKSTGEFSSFFFGSSVDSAVWHRPYFYYFQRIPSYIGWATLIFGLMGIMALLWNFKVFEKGDAKDHEYSRRDYALFAVVWIASTFLILLFSYGKPYWMIYSTLPAFALLGGWGISEAYRALSRRPFAAYSLVTLVLLAILITAVLSSYSGFMESADFSYTGAIGFRQLAEYVNQRGSKSSRTMISGFVPPIFAFYLESYRQGSIAELPKQPVKDNGKYKSRNLLVLCDNATFDEASRWLEITRPDFLIMRVTKNGLAYKFASFLKPHVQGNAWIFDTRGIQF